MDIIDLFAPFTTGIHINRIVTASTEKRVINLVKSMKKHTSERRYNLQQLNTAHTKWCIALHARNTTKFAYFQVTIDTIGGLNG